MKNLIFTTPVKTYVVKGFLDEHGQQYFSCSCIHFKTSCVKREVPCKHTLAVLFTGGDCYKWEALRDKFSKDLNIKIKTEAEMLLAVGLRNNEPNTLLWFSQNKD